jgi:hypothetical protein
MILAKAQAMLEALQEDYGKLAEDCGLTDVVLVVVRLFICTQNRLVSFHSAFIKAHGETNISPHSVIDRLVWAANIDDDEYLNNESPPAVVVTPHLQPPLGGWEAWTEIYFPRNCIEAQCSYGSSVAHTYPPILQIQQ